MPTLTYPIASILAMNPDAHSVAEIDLMRWGVAVARKGRVPAGKVLNARTAKHIASFFARRRQPTSLRKRNIAK